MSKTPDVVSQEMLAKLATTAPGFSFEVGTPERKIIDAVAEAVSECYIDQYLVGSLMDIENKSGLELEQWVAIFGYGRLQGKQSTGVVRVELTTANATDITIQLNQQFYTRQSLPGSASPLYFQATQSLVIPAGSFVTDVPVQCTTVGASGNVGPDSIVYAGDIVGTSSVTNLIAMTGGMDPETDDELRQRFKDTFMRNVAGTEDWYLGLAYQNVNISKALCVGPIRKYAIQIQVTNEEQQLDLPHDVKYGWPDSETVFKNLGQSDETFYRPYDDYTFYPGENPSIIVNPGGQMVAGDIVDVEFEYTTLSSRNDPQNGICNKVDLFVNGAAPFSVTERTIMTNTAFSANIGETPYIGDFMRVGTNETPAAGNYFMRLGSVPILSFPSSITIGTNTYQQILGSLPGQYYLVRGTTLDAGSIREVAGLEWTSESPSADAQATLSYVYNRVPEVLQAVVKKGKQLTTDVLVHQAEYAYLRLFLSIEYNRSFVVSQVNSAIQDRLTTYFAGMAYGAWIQMSDLNLAVHQVIGVDNVNITVQGENAASPDDFGVMLYGSGISLTGSTSLPEFIEPLFPPYIDDFKLKDNQLPIFVDVTCLRKPNH